MPRVPAAPLPRLAAFALDVATYLIIPAGLAVAADRDQLWLLPRSLGIDDCPREYGRQQARDTQSYHHVDQRSADLSFEVALQRERQHHRDDRDETNNPAEENSRARCDHGKQVRKPGCHEGGDERRD